MVYIFSNKKIPIWAKFGGPYIEWKMLEYFMPLWNLLRIFCIFFAVLVILYIFDFLLILYIFCHFSKFCPEKSGNLGLYLKKANQACVHASKKANRACVEKNENGSFNENREPILRQLRLQLQQHFCTKTD
jgi:hypothetical protein